MSHKWSKKKIFTVILLVCLVIAGGQGYRMVRAQIIDETNSVHIKADEIEVSTLIVGTHLIYLGAMSDTIYETAITSQQNSSQFRIYYKSELADGTWYDITDASTLQEITAAGVPVDKSVIEALNMTHHTKSDGITYDLRTNKAVSVFDVSDPYDLEGLTELEPIKTQHTVLSETDEDERTATNKRDLQLINELFGIEIKTEVTEKCDEQLENLNEYYVILQRDGADSSTIDMCQKIMEKIDATRRAAVFEKLKDDLKREVEVKNPKVIVRYYNGDGTIIYDLTYKPTF